MAAINQNFNLGNVYNDIWENCKDGLEGLSKEEKIELISNMIFMKLSSTNVKNQQLLIDIIVSDKYKATQNYKDISEYVKRRLNPQDSKDKSRVQSVSISGSSSPSNIPVLNHFQNLEKKNPEELRSLGKLLFQLATHPEHKESAKKLLNEFMQEAEHKILSEEKRIVFVGYLDCVLHSLEKERNFPKLHTTYEYLKSLLSDHSKDENPLPSISNAQVSHETAKLVFNRLKNLEHESEQELQSLGQLLFKLTNQQDHKESAQSIIDQFKQEAIKEIISEKEKTVFFAYLDCVMNEAEKNNSFGLWAEAFVYKADLITSTDKKVPDLSKDATTDAIREHPVRIGHFLES